MTELTEWQDNFLYGLVSRLLLVDLNFTVSANYEPITKKDI